MKKIIIFLGVLCLTLFSCSNNTSKTDTNVQEEKKVKNVNIFELIDDPRYRWYVVYDKETMVEYAVSMRGVFTMLVDSTGKPKLYVPKDTINHRK